MADANTKLRPLWAESARPRKAATRALYATLFSRQERSALASLVGEDTLDAEIDLLRVLIRRLLAGPPADHFQDGGAVCRLDDLRINRLIAALCRAIKLRFTVRSDPRREFDDTCRRVLEEIHAEYGIGREQQKDSPRFQPPGAN